jgi:hypothetical protein
VDAAAAGDRARGWARRRRGFVTSGSGLRHPGGIYLCRVRIQQRPVNVNPFPLLFAFFYSLLLFFSSCPLVSKSSLDSKSCNKHYRRPKFEVKMTTFFSSMFQSLCVTMLHQGLERTVRIALHCIACTDPITSLVMLTSRRKKRFRIYFCTAPLNP